MVCWFCIAVFLTIAGAIGAVQLDEIEDKLRGKARDGVVRTVDSGSVARFELTAVVRGKAVPVTVTVFKDHRRVRIQILSHDLNAEERKVLEEELADALEAEIVDRSNPESEEIVEEAAGDHHAARERAREADRQADRQRAERGNPDSAPPRTR